MIRLLARRRFIIILQGRIVVVISKKSGVDLATSELAEEMSEKATVPAKSKTESNNTPHRRKFCDYG